MPGLLDYIIQDYQNGGAVRHDDLGWAGSGSFLGTETADPFTTFSSNPFDPSALPTQEDIFGQYDIELTDDKFKPFIPTYDQTGEDFLRTNYMQDRQGLYAGGRSALGQLGQKSSQTSAQQGFAGMGKNLLDTTRGDIVDEFGRQSQKAYSGLQQDIYGRRKDYERDVLSAIGDLEPYAYTVGGDDGGDVTDYDFSGEGGSPTIGVGAGNPTHAIGDTITNPDTGQVWTYSSQMNFGASPPQTYYYWSKG